ncbi:MAG: carboxypeptidase-like regulatory domain-containing protein, partial [Muribaculaceae bacterium]|nr:carboxypeptidase-like regulatory domain-containing protein [Muribaculaceae bacterium]
MFFYFYTKILKKPVLGIIAAVFFALMMSGRTWSMPQWEQTSGSYLVKGIVTDSITGEGLPYASVTLDGAAGGAVADSKGVFEFKVPVSTKALRAAMVGYQTKSVPLKQTSHNMYVVRLSPETTELRELVVRKKKYSKKNNPAVDFVRSIKAHTADTDPLRHDYYNNRKYERITLAINNFEPNDSGALMRAFPFLREHVDTSE